MTNETRKPNGWRTFAFKMAVLALVWLLLATTFAAQFYWIGKDWPVKISWKASFLRALVEWCPWMILSPAVMWLAERCRFDRARWLWGVFPHLPACVLVTIAFQGISLFLTQRQGTVVFHEFQHGGGIAGFAKSANSGLIGDTADDYSLRIGQDSVRATNLPPGTPASKAIQGAPPQSPVIGDSAPPPRMPGPWTGFLQLAATRAQSTIPIYWAIVCVTWVISYYQQLRARERHALELEARLTQANLQTLKTQLQPHFLFNTLNAIASFVRKKPEVAEAMIGSLSEFLRMNLEAAPQHEVPLRRELEFLNLYLEIQQARFKAALQRAREYLQKRSAGETDGRILALLERLRPERNYVTRFAIKSASRVAIVKAGDIDWIESAANYALLHVGDKTHVHRETMRALEEQLSPTQFLRISRSVIVNIERIKEIQPMMKGEYVVELHNGKQLTMTRGIRELQQALGPA